MNLLCLSCLSGWKHEATSTHQQPNAVRVAKPVYTIPYQSNTQGLKMFEVSFGQQIDTHTQCSPKPFKTLLQLFWSLKATMFTNRRRTPSAEFHFHLVLPPRYWCAGGFFRPSQRVKAPLGSVSCQLYGSRDLLLWTWRSTAMKSLSLVKHCLQGIMSAQGGGLLWLKDKLKLRLRRDGNLLM